MYAEFKNKCDQEEEGDSDRKRRERKMSEGKQKGDVENKREGCKRERENVTHEER